MIKVLIADDHTLFRRGLTSLLNETNEFAVVGEAGSGIEAVALAKRLTPDVVLMDIHMPGGDGLEATKQLHADLPALPILMLTVSENDSDLVKAIRAGARGYFLKNADTQDLLGSLRRVVTGQAVIDPSLTDALFQYVANPAALDTALSHRETEILKQVADGRTNREIASTLNVSENTIKTHIAHILEKLQVTSRTEAVALARARGWLF